MAKASNSNKTAPRVRKASKSAPKSKSSKERSQEKTPILLVLAQFKSMGNDAPSRKQGSQLSGYPEKSLATMLLNMKKKHGHVEYNKDSVWLTAAGWQAAQTQFGDQISQVLDNDTAQENLKSMHNLNGAKLKIFNLLTDGSAKSFDELMEAIGCNNAKSFGTYTSALKTAGLAETLTEGGVKKLRLVESVCFPFGRPN